VPLVVCWVNSVGCLALPHKGRPFMLFLRRGQSLTARCAGSNGPSLTRLEAHTTCCGAGQLGHLPVSPRSTRCHNSILTDTRAVSRGLSGSSLLLPCMEEKPGGRARKRVARLARTLTPMRDDAPEFSCEWLSDGESRMANGARLAAGESKPSNVKGLSLKSQLGLRRGAPSKAAYCRLLKWAICAIELLLTGLLFHR